MSHTRQSLIHDVVQSKMKITRLGALGMLAVLRPSRILVFVVIWNILFGIGVLLDGGMHSTIKTVGGNPC